MRIIADTHKNGWPSFAVFSGETGWKKNCRKTNGEGKVQAGRVEDGRFLACSAHRLADSATPPMSSANIVEFR
jgi:hypothetical protein